MAGPLIVNAVRVLAERAELTAPAPATLAQPSTLPNPTIIRTVAVPVIAQPGSMPQPGVARAGSATVVVNSVRLLAVRSEVGGVQALHIANSETMLAPTVGGRWDISFGPQSFPSTVHAPTVGALGKSVVVHAVAVAVDTRRSVVSPPLLITSSIMHEPYVGGVLPQTIEPYTIYSDSLNVFSGTLSAPSVMWAPTVDVTEQRLLVDTIIGAGWVFDPSINAVQTVTMPVISAPTTLQSTIVTGGSIPAQAVAPNIFISTLQLQAPTLSQTGRLLAPSTIAQPGSVPAPSLIGAIGVTAPLLVTATVLHEPAVLRALDTQVVQALYIWNPETVWPPSTNAIPQAVSLAGVAGVIENLASVLAPEVIGGQLTPDDVVLEVFDGQYWRQVGFDPLNDGDGGGGGGGTVSWPLFHAESTSDDYDELAVRRENATYDQFAVQTDGTLKWGPGNIPTDVVLYRSADHLLRTDDDLMANRLRLVSGLTVPDATPTGRFLQDDGTWADPVEVSVKAQRTTSQTVTNGAWTTVSWQSAEWDTHALFNSSAYPTRISIPSDFTGRYTFDVTLVWAADADGGRYLAYRKNGGADVVLATPLSAGGLVATAVNASFTIDTTAGDYIEFRVFHGAGGSIGFTGWVTASRVAAEGRAAPPAGTTFSSIVITEPSPDLRIPASVPTGLFLKDDGTWAAPTASVAWPLGADDVAVNAAVLLGVTGEANDRYAVRYDGTTYWGGGSGAVDTTLARTAAGELTLTSALKVTSTIYEGGTALASKYAAVAHDHDGLVTVAASEPSNPSVNDLWVPIP